MKVYVRVFVLSCLALVVGCSEAVCPDGTAPSGDRCEPIGDAGTDASAGSGGGGTGGSGAMGGGTGGMPTCADEGASCGTDDGDCVAGTIVCDGVMAICMNEVGPTDETCDDNDNDCDNAIDEEIDCACTNGAMRGCGTDEGLCTTGQQTCVSGAWSACSGVGPVAEVCDGEDNNCNGVDDDLPAPNCRPTSTRACTTTCGSTSSQTCGAGCTWGTCAPPAEAMCDNQDDDCDGVVDENLLAAGAPQTGGTPTAGVAQLVALSPTTFAMIAVNENFANFLQKLDATGAAVGQPLVFESLRFVRVLPVSATELLVFQNDASFDPPTMIEVRRVSMSGDPQFVAGSSWLKVMDVGTAGFSAVPGLAGEAILVAGRDAVRFPITPTAPTMSPTTVQGPSIAGAIGPNIINVYPTGGNVRVATVNKSTLTVVEDLLVGAGAGAHVASNNSGQSAVAYRSSTGELSFVELDSTTLRCASNAALLPQSCVETPGVTVDSVSDLAFNGNHWLVTARFSMGWGLRALNSSGEIVGGFDSTEDQIPSVASAGNGDALTAVVNVAAGLAPATGRSFGCN